MEVLHHHGSIGNKYWQSVSKSECVSDHGLLLIHCSVFWPAGVFFSQAGIMVSYCLVGCGCAIIASATSAYCLLAGPPEYAISRLLVMQCAQALGSTLAASVGNGVFPRGIQFGEEKLDQVNLSYLVSQ